MNSCTTCTHWRQKDINGGVCAKLGHFIEILQCEHWATCTCPPTKTEPESLLVRLANVLEDFQTLPVYGYVGDYLHDLKEEVYCTAKEANSTAPDTRGQKSAS